MPKSAKRAKTKPESHANDAQLVLRLPIDLLDRLDAHAARMREELPGAKFKRAEVVRVLLTKALDGVERKRGRR